MNFRSPSSLSGAAGTASRPSQCERCGAALTGGAHFCASCGHDVTSRTRLSPPAALHTSLLATLRERLAPDYAVERELGRGGMAVVFRATEVALRRPVALKVLPPEMAMLPSVAERFRREARVAASLAHPNIIDVYRVGEVGGMSYMAMRLVEGRALDAIVETQGPLAIGVVLHVLRGTIGALAHAHEHGIIHRDIKGGNILVDADGRVSVTDFGIARAVEDATLTASGQVIGTPTFMSPEQCAGLALGPQCDQYAAGVLAFQLLTGAVPFESDTLMGIMHHHFHTPVPAVGLRRDDVPGALADVVTRALAKKPAERYATTREMLAAVEAIPFSDSDRREAEATLRALAASTDADVNSATAHGGPTRRLDEPARTTVPPRVGSSETTGARVERRVMMIAVGLVLAIVALGGGGASYLLHRRTGVSSDLERGVELYAAGRHEAARLRFEKAARLSPALAEPHVYLGRLARERGDDAAASRELATAVSLDPQNFAALREMGSSMLAAGNYEAARRFYVRALTVDPSDHNALGYLGCALVKLGREREGERFMRRAGRGSWSGCSAH